MRYRQLAPHLGCCCAAVYVVLNSCFVITYGFEVTCMGILHRLQVYPVAANSREPFVQQVANHSCQHTSYPCNIQHVPTMLHTAKIANSTRVLLP